MCQAFVDNMTAEERPFLDSPNGNADESPPMYHEFHLTSRVPSKDTKFIPVPLNFSIPGENYKPADPLDPPPPQFFREPTFEKLECLIWTANLQ